MTRFIVCMLILVLLAVNGCVASAHSTPESARQAATPTAISIHAAPLQTQPSAKPANSMPQRTAEPTVAPMVAPTPLDVKGDEDTQGGTRAK